MRFNQHRIELSVPEVLSNKESVFADTKNTKLFGNFFFPRGHLNDRNINEKFPTQAKYAVNKGLL